MDLSEHYERPLRVNYRAFVDQLLAGCIEDPELTPAEISRLPEPVRARLRNLVADECDMSRALHALRGSHVSADERLFAAAMWHYEEWTTRMGELVVGFSLAVSHDVGRIAADVVKPVIQSWQQRQRELFAPLRDRLNGILGASGLSTRLPGLVGRDPALRSPALGLGTEWTRQLSGTNRLFSPPPIDVRRGLTLPSAPAGLPEASLPPALRNMGRSSPAVRGLRHVAHVLPRLDQEATKGLRQYLVHLREQAAEHAALNRFSRRWEHSAEWFVLSLLSLRSSRNLFPLSTDELEAAILDALESAARDESFVRELQDAVERCALLERPQRHHIVHGLDHARRGEWLDACLPLLNGLEGAFWAAARAHNIIDHARYRLDQPKDRVHGVEKLFKFLPVAPQYVTFLRHRVFGGAGDPFRHGDATEGERRQALFAIAALAGWLDEFADTPARYALGSRIQDYLIQAPPARDLPAA